MLYIAAPESYYDGQQSLYYCFEYHYYYYSNSTKRGPTVGKVTNPEGKL